MIMNSQLKRIENTLKQLEQKQTSRPHQEISHSSSRRDPSFPIAVQPFPTKQEPGKIPSLPKVKSPSFSNHENNINPALAVNLLKDIQKTVTGWERELKDVLRQIQDIYLEGPILDGWLESHARSSETGDSSVRIAERDRLMNYIEEITNANVSYQSPKSGYHLCGLDADGQVWSHPCPASQVASVSVAIARYHKLRQLLTQKEDLENRLSQLSETLFMLRRNIQD